MKTGFESMKDFNEDIRKDAPGGWTIIKLKYVSELDPKCNTSHLRDNDSVTFAPMECIRTGYRAIKTELFSKYSPSYSSFCEGDIAIAKVTPCFENGNIVIMENLQNGYGFGSSELYILRSYRINNKFLFYSLQSDGFRQYCISKMTGAGGLKRVPSYCFKNAYIIKPNDRQQNIIAQYLDAKSSAIDSIIALIRSTIEDYKKYKSSIIYESVTKGLNPDVEMKDSGVEWIGEMPEYWKISKLKYSTQILRGKFSHRPRNDPRFYDGQYPFIQTGDITKSTKFINNYSQTLNELGFSVSKEFPKGSIVMTIAANVGDVAILNFDACFPDSVIGFVPSSNTYWIYLFYALKALKEELLKHATISTQLNLNIEIIKEIKIPLMPLKEQQAIANYLDTNCAKIDSLIAKKEALIADLEAYKKSLINECVTGKKQISKNKDVSITV